MKTLKSCRLAAACVAFGRIQDFRHPKYQFLTQDANISEIHNKFFGTTVSLHWRYPT